MSDNAHSPAPAKRRRWPWFVGIPAAVLVVAASCSDGPDAVDTTPAAAPAAVAPAEPIPAAEPELSGTVGAGVYEVPADIPAGKWKTAGPGETRAFQMDMCYWSRSADSTGDFDSLITNGIIEGPGVVTVNDGETVEFTGPCEWEQS